VCVCVSVCIEVLAHISVENDWSVGLISYCSMCVIHRQSLFTGNGWYMTVSK
jgi:hypothetical protein